MWAIGIGVLLATLSRVGAEFVAVSRDLHLVLAAVFLCAGALPR